MQRAVSPKPVAAMLAASCGRSAWVLVRSLTIPVFGFPCSQKKRKLAASTSLRNWSSSGERAGSFEVVAIGFCACKAQSSGLGKKGIPLAPSICLKTSRRERRLGLSSFIPQFRLTRSGMHAGNPACVHNGRIHISAEPLMMQSDIAPLPFLRQTFAVKPSSSNICWKRSAHDSCPQD